MTDEILARRERGVLHLTLNRALKRNALSARTVEELIQQLEEAADTPPELVVLRGDGPCFSAGLDLSNLDTSSDGDLLLRLVRIEQLLDLLYRMPCSTLALVHGPVRGAGADLMCACAWRVAAPQTNFRLPGLRFGVVLGTRRLVSRVGCNETVLIQRSGETIDAVRAAAVGLVCEVRPQTEWNAVVERAAADAATVSPLARPGFARALASADSDADLAELVRSAAKTGLADRIRAFRATARAEAAGAVHG